MRFKSRRTTCSTSTPCNMLTKPTVSRRLWKGVIWCIAIGYGLAYVTLIGIAQVLNWMFK